MNLKIITAIKNEIKEECERSSSLRGWFYETHLLEVEKQAKYLLRELPEADKEAVLLGVWLHDLQLIRGIKGEHQQAGAREAGKFIKDFGYDNDMIGKVKGMILVHSCNRGMPKTLEEKILASADAMAHYYNNFFLKIALTGERDYVQYREWVLEKLDRNYNTKIYFNFAKKKIKPRHGLYRKVFSIKA